MHTCLHAGVRMDVNGVLLGECCEAQLALVIYAMLPFVGVRVGGLAALLMVLKSKCSTSYCIELGTRLNAKLWHLSKHPPWAVWSC